MIEKMRSPRIYFGWWMVIVSGIVSGLGIGFYTLGISALFKPIATELGLTRAAASTAAGIGRLLMCFTAPLVGWLSDRFGPKWVVITGLCFTIIGLISMNYITSALAYYVAWGVIIGIGNNIALTIAIDKTLTNWFVSRRGLALGMRFALVGICGVIVVPVVTSLVVAEGWRMTCLIWAGVTCLGIPLFWVFIKQKRPEHYGLLPDGVTVDSATETDKQAILDRGVQYAASFQETEFTLRQAVKTRAFLFMLLAGSCYIFIMGGFQVHCIPFLTDIGIAPAKAGGMMAMMVFFMVPSRLLAGFLADRVRKDHLKFLAAGAYLLSAIGFTAFLLHQTVTMVYVFFILYGFGIGAPTLLQLTMGGRYFGRKAFASIQGTTILFSAPVALFAPIYTGWVYDTTGSYTPAFTIFAVLAVVGAILICFIRTPEPPEQTTDVSRFM